MKRLIGLAALLVLGCNQPDNSGPSGLDLSAMDKSADPCADFYQYACGGWIKGHPVGDDASLQAKFYDPYYEALPRLRSIMEVDAAGGRAPDDPHAALIGDYYQSCTDGPADLSSRGKLAPLLAEIDAVATLDDLARQVAKSRDVGSHSFFYAGVTVDPGDATRYIAFLSQGGYELGDPTYYLDPQYKPILTKYEAHINAMSALIGGTPIDAAAAIRVETKLAEASTLAEDFSDPEMFYHPMKAADAAALAPSFPWQTFWDKAGFGALGDVDVIVPEYVTALEKLFKETPLEDLKSYLRWQLLQDRSSGLDQAFIDEDFSFYSIFTGQVSQQPRWFVCFNKTLGALGQAVARPYVARYFSDASGEATSAMVERARGAFEGRLQAAAWLDSSTRTEAFDKLDAMVAKVGYPADPPDYTGLTIVEGSFFDNEVALRRFSNARSLARLGQKVDRSVWGLSPTTVNAIYTPTANDLTLPAALLTSPFWVSNRIEAANYGALGVVIGHEMTHGFDNNGRHYDSEGTLRDWWTPKVEASFVERSQCLVDQFDDYEALPGEHVNGSLTLGENIADLGGVHIAYAALFDGDEQLDGGDDFTAEQVFFLSYAQTHCENVRPDLQSQWLLSEPHSPGRFRVNGPLSNLPELRDAFSCPEHSAMVRDDPCELW